MYRSSADGFTLLEALVALALLGAVVVVGIETVGLGAAARSRAAEHAVLRMLAKRQLAEIRTAPTSELSRMMGRDEGDFGPTHPDVTWERQVSEQEPGSGLFHVEIELRQGATSLRAETYVNRFGDLWTQASREVR